MRFTALCLCLPVLLLASSPMYACPTVGAFAGYAAAPACPSEPVQTFFAESTGQPIYYAPQSFYSPGFGAGTYRSYGAHSFSQGFVDRGFVNRGFAGVDRFGRPVFRDVSGRSFVDRRGFQFRAPFVSLRFR